MQVMPSFGDATKAVRGLLVHGAGEQIVNVVPTEVCFECRVALAQSPVSADVTR